MGFRYQRRVRLRSGLGLNFSKSGITPSYRTRGGSIGTRGFSLRSGIPGLSYRGSWGRGGSGAAIGLLVVLAVVGVRVALVLAVALLQLAWALLVLVVNALWFVGAMIVNGVFWVVGAVRQLVNRRQTP